MKTPTPEVRSRFVDCEAGTIGIHPGIVYGKTVSTPQSNATKFEGLHQLADAVEAAAKLPYVRKIWETEAIQTAINMVVQAESTGRFKHPNPASLISGILMASMFD